MRICAVILTFNEQLHIKRCIESAFLFAHDVVVVDSFSSDYTTYVARQCGARVLQHEWISHSAQFNWALAQLADEFDWFFRLDADEVISAGLASSLRMRLSDVESIERYSGISVKRCIVFWGQKIRFGGIGRKSVVRGLRTRRGFCEDRLMDEHMVVHGNILRLDEFVYDINLKPLRWWIDKHNKYSNMEAVEILDRYHSFLGRPAKLSVGKNRPAVGLSRWIKENVYLRLPVGIRAAGYFLHRVVFCLGIFDGPRGVTFHFLQGFWYRLLVDLKLVEVQDYIKEHSCSPEEAIFNVLGIEVSRIKVQNSLGSTDSVT